MKKFFCLNSAFPWIQIRIQIADPDPRTQMNADPTGSNTFRVGKVNI